MVDGVPSGGAFNPALTTLNLTDVDRIEVVRGAAPVMYGATSFVGVIHVIHYAAGAAPGALQSGALPVRKLKLWVMAAYGTGQVAEALHSTAFGPTATPWATA